VADIRIRMYRTGFGDCFLLSFGPSASARHILIDFGAHTHGEIGTMDAVMNDIESTTGRRIDLIVATHLHRDHISGFGKFAARFAAFTIGEVWRPWMDKPGDPDADELNRKHLALYAALERHFAAAPGAGVYAATARDALVNLTGNEKATSELGRAFGTGAKVEYLRAGDSRSTVAGITGLSAEVLGPPADKKFLSRMNPPSDQRFLAPPGEPSTDVHPFPGYELKEAEQDFTQAVTEGQPKVPDDDLPLLVENATAPVDRLALFLDNARNNTSLVILFRYHGKALLFPGDAQWGNWQSWIGTDMARQLLAEVDFIKLSHHGSENATPVDVVHALRANELRAMVSTQVVPFPTIPRVPLLQAVQAHCVDDVVIRSDWVPVANAPAAPPPVPGLPAGFIAGPVWIDCFL